MSVPLLTGQPVEVLAASAARTTTLAGTTHYNNEARGLLLTVAISAVTATPSLTPKVQYSPDNGTTWLDYCVITTPLAAAATSSYLIYPVIDATADGAMTESFSLPLPRCWRVVVTAGDTDSATYAVYGMYL